jgi:hypothetical protein
MSDERRPEPVEAARTFLAEHFRSALAGLVGGSVLTEHRTPTSDLDVVVVLDGPPAPYRETFEHDGWVVEAFVHDRASLEVFWDRDAARRSCSLLRMCAESVVVGDAGGVAAEIRAEAGRRLAAGPPPLEKAELDAMRYGLTDLLEDLAGSEREDEVVHIAAGVLRGTSELALAAGGRWGGTGKALARAVTAAEPELSERLVHAHRLVVLEGDTAPLYWVAAEVLGRVGGPLLAGYRAAGSSGQAGPRLAGQSGFGQ